MKAVEFIERGIVAPSGGKEVMMSTESALVHEEFVSETGEKGKGRLHTILTSALVIGAGLAVFKVTGLYDGLSSSAGKIGVGVLISYIYLRAFWRGYYAK